MNERAALPPIEPSTLKAQMQRKLSGRELLGLLLQMGIGAIVGGATMFLLLKGGVQLAPPGTNKALVVLLIVPALLAAMVVHFLAHELGHALVGQWMGGRILRVIVGPWRWELFRSGFRRVRVRSLKGIGGLAQTILPDGPNFRRAFVLMLLGGPFANLALAGIAWLLLPMIGPWPLRVIAAVFVAIGLLIGLVNLLPFRSGGFQTDGLQLLRSFTDPQGLAARRRVLRIARASIDGLRPRDIDPDDLAALDIDKSQGMAKLAAQMLHAGVAYDSGDFAQTRKLLEPALADWQKLPDGLRQSLAMIAALLSAEFDRDPAMSREWLQRAEAGLVNSFEFDWVRACIADLEGDAAGRDAALARMRAGLDNTVYLGEESVYREKMEALVAKAAAPA
jgi:hypothetical protein